MSAAPTFEPYIKLGRLTREMTFNQKVWALTVRIPRGKVTTYRHIARKMGTCAYRAVGQALHNNPYAPQVPCHRVVGSDRSLTGFAGGISKKRAMLKREGVTFTDNKVHPNAVIAI